MMGIDELHWTPLAPTEEGWYWYRGSTDTEPSYHGIIHIDRGFRNKLIVWEPYMDYTTDLDVFVQDQDCWWYGPIQAPRWPSDGSDPERQATPSVSDLRPLEGNVGPNRGYLGAPEGSQPGSFRAHLYDPYGEELDD